MNTGSHVTGLSNASPKIEITVHRTTEPVCQTKHTTLRRPLILLAAFCNLLCVVSLSAGCASHPDLPDTMTPTIAPEQPAEHAISPETVGQPEATTPDRPYFVEAGTSVPCSFNPLLPENDAAQRVVENVFDSLLKVNAETASLEPSLATQWSVSEDGLTITFHLVTDTLWHDGKPFTAEDVAFTFESILNTSLDTPFKAKLVGVDEYYATAPHTFVVTLNKADCSMVVSLGQIPIIPQHLFTIENDDGSSDTALIEDISWEHPIGTGPFKFTERFATGEVHLQSNVGYFGGPPHTAEWVYLPFADTQQILSGLREGEIDLAPISPQEVPYFQYDDHVQIVAFPDSEYYALMINLKHPLLNDVNTRKALAHAIDRQQLVQKSLDGYGHVVDSAWLQNHWTNTLAAPPMDYRPERAKELLGQAGWADSDGDHLLDRGGKPLQIDIAVNSENELRKQIALAVQQDWIEVGVSAEVHFVEFYALLEKLFAHTFDVAVFSWPIHPDPDQSLFWASEEAELQHDFNVIAYANPAVDEALLEGLIAPSCDPETRARAYQQVISAIEQDQPYIFLFVPQRIIAINRRLVGLRPGPYSNLNWNVSEWALEPTTTDS